MIKIFSKILPFLLFSAAFAQNYEGPVGPITNGFGAFGPQNVAVINFDNPQNNSNSEDSISLFYPGNSTGPVPAVFFAHGYLAYDTAFFTPLLRFIASKGFAAVYVPQTIQGVCTNYPILEQGFLEAGRRYSTIIDTSMVGFFGHSFGGGALPYLSEKMFKEYNWGDSAKFMFISAPWYSYYLPQTKLQNFPSDCALIMQVYEEDAVNDTRMAIDVFENIAIPDTEKDFITVLSDTASGGYVYSANHNLPAQNQPNFTGSSAVYNAQDYYAVFKILDALMDYKFNNNVLAKNTALGNGSIAQIDMGPLKDMIVTDSPIALEQESFYTFPCSNSNPQACPAVPQNPRNSFCSLVQHIEPSSDEISELVYPNPASEEINFHVTDIKMVEVFNARGQEIDNIEYNGLDKLSVNCSSWKNGIYLFRITLSNQNILYKRVLISK